MPDADHLQRLYRERFTDTDRADKARIWQVIVTSFLQRWIPHNAAVLDLGCGYGEFLNALPGRRRIGVDLNPESTDHLEPGIAFHLASATDLPFLADASVDVAFTSNLLEHLPDKAHVRQLLLEAHRVLRPGGTFLLIGPNLRYLPAAYWDYFDHIVPLTDRSLVEGLTEAGFDIAQAAPRFLPYTIHSPLPRWSWAVRAYLHSPWAWRILGRQFFIRAIRPTG